MADEDRTTIKIPKLMAADIDRWLETPAAKKLGVWSKSDLTVRLLTKFLSEYEQEYGIFMSREAARQPGGKDTPKAHN